MFLLKYHISLITCLYTIVYAIDNNNVSKIWKKFQPFQDPLKNEFGLLKINTTNVLPSFSSPAVKLQGYCFTNTKNKVSEIKAQWKQNDRKKVIYFLFTSDNLSDNTENELRWRLKNVTYIEKHGEESITFKSKKDSFMVTSPIRSKYICRDKLNITLSHDNYKDIVVQLLPEIEFIPFIGEKGYGSNIFICERTRKKSLSEAFQSKMTIIAGIVLGLSSISAIIIHSLRRTIFSPNFK
ncbi:Hypothetical protein SRAE_1000133900 [Strongyloides ratti]|uniref:Uncharacterized protein n=1 Tax=Strongyloides ratti TaxID=34506 RepID=A0A090L6D9_STRRB|nr:Hypothetical protein SRAE_1000133900 [Strongyloides ratti]CEF63074.1 Hypothetical protein SRAE_1000133900 [Strongyloides ratti]